MLNKAQLLDRWNKILSTVPSIGIYNIESNFWGVRFTPGSKLSFRIKKGLGVPGDSNYDSGASGATGIYVRSTAIPAYVIGEDAGNDLSGFNNSKLNVDASYFINKTQADAYIYYFTDGGWDRGLGTANKDTMFFNWGGQNVTGNPTTNTYRGVTASIATTPDSDGMIRVSLENKGTETLDIRFTYGFYSAAPNDGHGQFGARYQLDDQNLAYGYIKSGDGSIEVLSYDIKEDTIPSDQSTPMVTSATDYQSTRVIPIYSGKHLISKKDKWENKFSGAYDNRDNFKLPATHSLPSMQVRLTDLSSDNAKQYR